MVKNMIQFIPLTISFANQKNTDSNEDIKPDMSAIKEEKLKTLEVENASLKLSKVQKCKKSSIL